MFRKIITLIFILLISTVLSAQDKKLNIAIVAFYNVENFYDTIDDPITDDKEFLPDGIQNWNSAKYILKLQRIS